MFDPDEFFLDNYQRGHFVSFFRDSKSFENFENDYKIDDNAYNLLPFEDEGQNGKNSKFDNDENWQDFKSLDMVLDESKELSEQKIFDEEPLDGKLIEGKLIGEISTKEQTPNKEIKVKDFKCEEKPIENFINNGNIKNIKPKEKIFEISKVKKTKKKLPKYPRIDDGKIYFRVKINKWFIKSLNEKIRKSDLSKELKKIIHSPKYSKFTEKVTAKSTYKDLEKRMSTILCIGKEEYKNQRQNYENIQAILEFHKKNPTKSVGEIVKFLSMTYEEVIEEFYKSDEYEKLKENETARFYDEEIVKEKSISLFDNNGLIRLFKSYFQKEDKDGAMLGKKRRH